MDGINRSNSTPVTSIDDAAIAVIATSESQLHAGVLHRDRASGSVLMLDLAWHHRLRNESLSVECVWVNPAVPTRRLRHVAALCRRIWKANQSDGIPYAFSYPNDCIDADSGRFLIGPTQLGLTCATFVIAVFQASGLQLLRCETWPTNRPGDREWQEFIVSMLERHGAPAEHVSAVREQVGAARFRPDEVAGGATCTPLPADFATAMAKARSVRESLC